MTPDPPARFPPGGPVFLFMSTVLQTCMVYDLEHKNEKVISRFRFAQRMTRGLGTIGVLIVFSLMFGIAGYRFTEQMSWLDAMLNAAMILGGEGPVSPLHSTAGKVFASFYAIFSGLFLVACAGLLLTPVFHRVLHKFHAGE